MRNGKISLLTFFVLFILSSVYSQCLKKEVDAIIGQLKKGVPEKSALDIMNKYGWKQLGSGLRLRDSIKTETANGIIYEIVERKSVSYRPNGDSYGYGINLVFVKDKLFEFTQRRSSLFAGTYKRLYGAYPDGHDELMRNVLNGYRESVNRSINICGTVMEINPDDTISKPLHADSLLKLMKLGISGRESTCILDKNGWRLIPSIRESSRPPRVVKDKCGDTVQISQRGRILFFEPKQKRSSGSLRIVTNFAFERYNGEEISWLIEIKVMTIEELRKKYYWKFDID